MTWERKFREWLSSASLYLNLSLSPVSSPRGSDYCCYNHYRRYSQVTIHRQSFHDAMIWFAPWSASKREKQKRTFLLYLIRSYYNGVWFSYSCFAPKDSAYSTAHYCTQSRDVSNMSHSYVTCCHMHSYNCIHTLKLACSRMASSWGWGLGVLDWYRDHLTTPTREPLWNVGRLYII